MAIKLCYYASLDGRHEGSLLKIEQQLYRRLAELILERAKAKGYVYAISYLTHDETQEFDILEQQEENWLNY